MPAAGDFPKHWLEQVSQSPRRSRLRSLRPFRCRRAKMLHRLARIALLRAGISASALGQTGPIPAPIPHGPITIGLQPVASGLTAPVGLVQSPDNTGRKFIVDQVGKVRIVDSGGNLLATPFMDVATTGDFITFRSGYDERGLLGFTFDPNF